MKATIYNILSGEPLRIISAQKEEWIELQCSVGEAYYMAEVSPETTYFLRGEPAKRPEQLTSFSKTHLIADGVDQISITNAPQGTLDISGAVKISTEINGNETFTTTIAGEYKIVISAWPYLDYSITLMAE